MLGTQKCLINSSYYYYKLEKGFSDVDFGLFLKSQNAPVKVLPVNVAFRRVTLSGLLGGQSGESS